MWALIPEWLKRAVGWAVAGAAMLWAAWVAGKREGTSRANSDARDADYENAEDIRRRVSTDRAQRVRELDDAGWRD